MAEGSTNAFTTSDRVVCAETFTTGGSLCLCDSPHKDDIFEGEEQLDERREAPEPEPATAAHAFDGIFRDAAVSPPECRGRDSPCFRAAQGEDEDRHPGSAQ